MTAKVAHHNLTPTQKAAFGVGAVGKDMVYALTATFVMYFYQDVMGLSASFVGLILLIARVFDAVNDPVMGVLVGKTRTRWGRFRPWLFSGTVVNAFVLFALYATPNIEGAGLMVYFATTYILWGLTYTMMDIPFWAIIPAVTRTPESRENLSVIGRTCAGIGGAIVNSLTMAIVAFLGNGNEHEGFRIYALIICILFILAEVLLCILFKEGDSPEEMQTSSVKEMFMALFRNDQAMVIVVSIVLFYLGMSITNSMYIYFFKYDIGGADWNIPYTTFTTTASITQIISMMLIYPLLRRKLDNMKIFSIGMLGLAAGYTILLLLAVSDIGRAVPFLLYIVSAWDAICIGLVTVLITLFLANTVDYGQMKTGKREESMIFSMQTFVVKAGSGFAAFLVGLGLDLVGLVGSGETEIVAQSASTIMGLDLIMTVPAIAALVIGFFWFKMKWFLTDEKAQEIIDELVEKGELSL